MANDIQNSASRIWSNTQLKETVNQFKAANKLSPGAYGIEKTPETCVITHLSTGQIVLKSLKGPGIANIVRFNQSYFES